MRRTRYNEVIVIYIKVRTHKLKIIGLLCAFALLAGCQNNTSEVEMSFDISSSITESQSSQTSISQSEESLEEKKDSSEELREIIYEQSIGTIPLDSKERTVKVRFVNSAGLYVTAQYYAEKAPGGQVTQLGYRLEPTEVQTNDDGEVDWKEFEEDKYAIHVTDVLGYSENYEVYCLDLSDGGSNIYEFLWEHE